MVTDGGLMRSVMVAVLAAAAVALAACAGPQREFQPAFLSGDQGVIYVLRLGEGLGGGETGVVVNQEPIGELRPGEYLAHVVPPGEHLVRVEGASSAVARVRVAPGESVYVRTQTGGFPSKTTVQRLETADGRTLITDTREAVAHAQK